MLKFPMAATPPPARERGMRRLTFRLGPVVLGFVVAVALVTLAWPPWSIDDMSDGRLAAPS